MQVQWFQPQPKESHGRFFIMELNKVYLGNAIDIIKTFPDESINCVVTSTPYYGLRDYGTGKWIGGDPNCKHFRESKKSDKTITGHKRMQENDAPVGDAIYKTVCPICGAVRVDEQIGLEETPEEYIERLVALFREIRRCLKKDGTLWINIGDTYNGAKRGNTEIVKHKNVAESCDFVKKKWDGAKQKDLIGIPWLLAFALRADGWYLRQDIIWHKPNPMPESVTDRCTKSHEYIFLLSKSKDYYFDYKAIQEEAASQDDPRVGNRFDYGVKRKDNDKFVQGSFCSLKTNDDGVVVRNKRDVWTVNLKPIKETHFATYPEELIVPCILAGCPEKGVVLDPFMGSGTTGIVARKLNRNFVGCELNPDYCKMATFRIFNNGENLFNQ